MISAFKKESEKREPVTVMRYEKEFLILDGNEIYLNAIASRWANILCSIDR
jgi:hypothetical protein